MTAIALFTVRFSIKRVCEASSVKNYKIARNCLTYMLDYIVMQMALIEVNSEKGDWTHSHIRSDVVPRLQIILLVKDSTSPGNEFGEFNDVSSFWLGRIVVKFAIRKTFIFKVNETVTLESPRIILSSFFGELFPNILSCFL